jgi:hypothetical protein
MHLRPASPPVPELEPLVLPLVLPPLLPPELPPELPPLLPPELPPELEELLPGVVLLLHPGVPTKETPATRMAAAPNESLAKFVMIPFFTFWSVGPAPGRCPVMAEAASQMVLDWYVMN